MSWDVAQWQSTCLTCLKPWAPLLVPEGEKQQILGLITKTVLPLIYAKNKNQLSFSNLKSEAKQTEFNTIL